MPMATRAGPQEGELTLGQLLTRSLRNADKALISSTLSDLTLCASLVNHLAVFSPNETLEDISTRDLRALLVPAVEAQLALLVRTHGGTQRLAHLERAQGAFRRYLDSIERYQIVDADRRKTLAGPRIGDVDPARRRAGKIAQFKMEREIKGTLEELRVRRRKRRARGSVVPSASEDSPSALTTTSISSRATLAAPATASTSSAARPESAAEPEAENDDFPSSDDDDDAESVARPLLLNLLTLHYLRAHAELDSIEQEMEILRHGMRMSEIPSTRSLIGELGAGAGGSGSAGRDERTARGAHAAASRSRRGEAGGLSDEEGDEDEDNEDRRWRLDVLPKEAGPVLSSEGKVLRPFTILPSKKGPLSTRLRLQSEVFRDGHRLPTMSIDEFLDREEQRGNVLQGGGPSTSEAVEQERRDEEAAKEEDTVRGYEEEERGLKKAREWDDYRDSHRKGEGNMHNRG
ncbi:Type 2A phosphatase-associated protein 42 [Rhodotorula sphaerocarpa]